MKKNRTGRYHRIALCGFCALTLVLTACTGTGVPVRKEATVTLPPAQISNVAPIGDAALEYTGAATLYLPRTDSSRLISITDAVTFSAARPNSESVIRALLLHPGDGIAQPLGGEVKLSLYGANPVEISGDVATVNLAASALQLDRKMLYICAQAITNTLTELSPIRYVNVLVMDKQIGLDLSSTFPCGTLTRSVSSDIGAVYEQTLSQRAKADENPEDRKLAATVSLYFPMATVNGIMTEARNVFFAGQSPDIMIQRLLRELSDGPSTLSGALKLPPLADLLESPPTLQEPSDSGGRLVELHFKDGLWAALDTAQISRVNFMASICYTVSTFIPNVTGIVMYVGTERVDHVMIGATNGLLFENGVQLRAHYASFLLDQCTLYFANAENTALIPVRRPIPYYQRTSPRALLLELFAGPSVADSVQNLQPVIPVKLMKDADILGISLNEQTLLVNYSRTFTQAGANLTPQQDRLLAYAITNTLLCGDRAKRVCYFVGGNTPENFSGEIDWAGMFYPNPGLAGL